MSRCRVPDRKKARVSDQFFYVFVSECSSGECHELMLQLKVTVDGLLALPSANVWNIHGGLERLVRCIRHILKHRLKPSYVCNGSLHFLTATFAEPIR